VDEWKEWMVEGVEGVEGVDEWMSGWWIVDGG
jgi:hypothetical protein